MIDQAYVRERFDYDAERDASKAYLAAKAKYHTFNPIPREEACGCHTTSEVSM